MLNENGMFSISVRVFCIILVIEINCLFVYFYFFWEEGELKKLLGRGLIGNLFDFFFFCDLWLF